MTAFELYNLAIDLFNVRYQRKNLLANPPTVLDSSFPQVSRYFAIITLNSSLVDGGV